MHELRQRTFEGVFREFHPKILSYVSRRVSSSSYAEEIAAEVFQAAWDRWDSEFKVVAPWLYRVALNKIIDHYRSSERRNLFDTEMTIILKDSVSKPDFVEVMAIRDAVGLLNKREQEVIFRYYWEGLSALEIADLLGCRPATVWAALSRARKRLRALLSTNG